MLLGSDRPGTTQLYRVSARGGELEQLTDLADPVEGFFVPGSGRILLELDEGGNERTQLYLLDARAGAEPEPLVVEPDAIHRTPHVTRDGTLLAYATNRRNGRDFDVVVRDLAGGSERIVLEAGSLDVLGFSPDGLWLAVFRDNEQRSNDNDLLLVDVRSGEGLETSLHDDSAFVGAPAWLPGGDAFLAPTSIGRDTAAVGRYDLAGGRWKIVLESEWDLDVEIDDAGTVLVVEANEDGYSRLTLYDPQTLAPLGEVPLPGRGVVERRVLWPDGSRLAYRFSSAREPGDVWLYDLRGGETTRLTDAGAGEHGLAEPELHRFRSFDGEPVPVFLWEPEGEGPFPVVVMVHGGPESQLRPRWAPSFTPLTHYLLSRGYAVAAPNVRGSTGYGKRYEHLDDVRLRLDSVRDLAALHEWLARRPRLDTSRAVLYGRSYGGYMTLAGLAFQPDRWAAGIEAVGIASLVTFLENTGEWRRAVREREYGSLERDRDFLVEASPLQHVDRIRAPLLIQHGANDPRVPLGEAQQIHRALQHRGIRTELVVYEDEGHTIDRLENRIDFFTRAAAFLDEVLG